MRFPNTKRAGKSGAQPFRDAGILLLLVLLVTSVRVSGGPVEADAAGPAPDAQPAGILLEPANGTVWTVPPETPEPASEAFRFDFDRETGVAACPVEPLQISRIPLAGETVRTAIVMTRGEPVREVELEVDVERLRGLASKALRKLRKA